MKSKRKTLARELQEARGCAYSAALNELNGLPEGTDLRVYVDRVKALPASLRIHEREAGR